MPPPVPVAMCSAAVLADWLIRQLLPVALRTVDLSDDAGVVYGQVVLDLVVAHLQDNVAAQRLSEKISIGRWPNWGQSDPWMSVTRA